MAITETKSTAAPKRIVILGGGFAGMYAAMELDKTIARDPDVTVTLVNRENFFLFTPMLHEVAASDLDLTHIVSPIRKMLKYVQFFEGDIEAIDTVAQTVRVSHGSDSHTHDLPYDHLVLAMGAVTNYFGLPGLEERALTMRSLGDAIYLRNRVISHLEEADTECAANRNIREPLLTFLVAGGGFAGVETVAALNDFVAGALPYYPNLSKKMVRVVLVHSGEYILPEMGESLGRYAQGKLAERGVEIRTKARVAEVDGRIVRLNDGTEVDTFTLVWTAGSSSHPLVASLPCANDKGRVPVETTLEVKGNPGIWALGDCAVVPDTKGGGVCPPTAQHALRQGTVAARNIIAAIRGGEKKPFEFTSPGLLASIGHRTGVARLYGQNFSGFIAWFLWRGIYLSKLPRWERRVRVAFDWALDLIFGKDTVKFLTARSPHISIREEDMRLKGKDAMLPAPKL